MKSAVTIYHDETQVGGTNYYGHVLFFVPDEISATSINEPYLKIPSYSPRVELLQQIERIRNELKQDRKFHFCELSGKSWGQHDRLYLKLSHVLTESLRKKQNAYFKRAPNCKLAVIYYPEIKRANLYRGADKKENKFRYDETMLRILIKGACHYLYNDDDQVVINRMVADGRPEHRFLDDYRVVWSLNIDEFKGRTPLKDFVEINPSFKIIHLDSNHKKHKLNSDEYHDANLLQCADLFLGAANNCIFPPEKTRKDILTKHISDWNKKSTIAYPLRTMLEKLNRGKGFINSSHYDSFSISKIEFTGNTVSFTSARELFKPITHTKPFEQLSLFD